MALRLLIALAAFVSLIAAVPLIDSKHLLEVRASNATHAKPQPGSAQTSSSYWVANIARNGAVPYGGASGYQIYRNVMDFGATGDGSTDDTAAINSAISSGNRCGQGCDSSTITPALVYFPPGTYVVSSPIIQYYYTQLVGDAINPPTILASSSFGGIAVIDSDPYESGGANWYVNQNNFYRQVRNFVIDLTQLGMGSGAGIHWQVAQATSLQNIVFNMVQGGGTANKQIGIFMDNGSGGFMTDLVFNGGNYGAFFGNQQFTSRNMTFNGCNTAIFMNWNWVWSLKSVTVNNCGVGIDMSNSPSNQTVGSVLLIDSVINNTPVGIITAFDSNSVPTTGGTLIVDNVDFSSCSTAIQSNSGSTILGGGSVVSSWVQGSQYTGNSGSRVQGSQTGPNKSGLTGSNGYIFEQSKDQYQSYPASAFVSVKSQGAAGDGVTDDTAAIQNAMNNIASGQILYFDHGAYVVSSTITVPDNIIITGEVWPMIMASGSAFQDQNNLTPVFQVGQSGSTGSVQISDLIFETIGPQPGATLLQWNLAGSAPGDAGIWDVHFRVGGSAGTQLQSNTCASDPTDITNANPSCIGAGLLFHVTSSASLYVENTWAWVADHELDIPGNTQINVFNGRGILIESTSPTWWYGTSAEHSVFYNYRIAQASAVFMTIIQAETPYFQSNPNALDPFTQQTALYDPTFQVCASGDNSCLKSWGLNIIDSSQILIYGTGLYSFYDNYDQSCLATESCQQNMIHVVESPNVVLYGASTKAATNMIMVDTTVSALDSDNRNNFCATVAYFVPGGS